MTIDTQNAAFFERATATLLGFIKRMDSARALTLEQEIAGMTAGEQLDRVIQRMEEISRLKQNSPPMATLSEQDRKYLTELRGATEELKKATERLRSTSEKPK